MMSFSDLRDTAVETQNNQQTTKDQRVLPHQKKEVCQTKNDQLNEWI